MLQYWKNIFLILRYYDNIEKNLKNWSQFFKISKIILEYIFEFIYIMRLCIIKKSKLPPLKLGDYSSFHFYCSIIPIVADIFLQIREANDFKEIMKWVRAWWTQKQKENLVWSMKIHILKTRITYIDHQNW